MNKSDEQSKMQATDKPKKTVCRVCDGEGKGYFGEMWKQICDACEGTGRQTDNKNDKPK